MRQKPSSCHTRRSKKQLFIPCQMQMGHSVSSNPRNACQSVLEKGYPILVSEFTRRKNLEA